MALRRVKSRFATRFTCTRQKGYRLSKRGVPTLRLKTAIWHFSLGEFRWPQVEEFQVAIRAGFGNATQALLAARAVLARHQSQPGAELAATDKVMAFAHRGHNGAGCGGPMPLSCMSCLDCSFSLADWAMYLSYWLMRSSRWGSSLSASPTTVLHQPGRFSRCWWASRGICQ